MIVVVECVHIVSHADGAGQADWPIAGSRLVNDVRGRRSHVGDSGNTQLNSAEDVSLGIIFSCTVCSFIMMFLPH